jgi:hypothetical protein
MVSPCLCLSAYLFWSEWKQPPKTEVAAAPVPSQSPSAPGARKQPKFSEKITGLRINMGGGEDKKTLAQLQSSNGAVLITGPGIDVIARATNEVLYLDVDFLWKSDKPPLRVRNNELSNKPVGWDMNSDDTAMELVDAKKSPILQLVYPTDSTAVIRAFFTNEMGFAVFSDEGMNFGGRPAPNPTNNPLTRIFEYPSYKFPGKRVNNATAVGGNGGNVNIRAGDSGPNGAKGGDVNIQSGNAPITIQGGNAK